MKNKYIILLILPSFLMFCYGCSSRNYKEYNNETKGDFEVEQKVSSQIQNEKDLTNSENSTSAKTTKITKTTITSTKSKESETDNLMSNVKFIVVDNKGNPVSNLRISLKHLTGDKYYYSPELSYTNSKGILYTSIGMKKYEITIEDKDENKVSNTYKSTFTVNESSQTFRFVWPYESPEERKKREKQGITFEFKTNNKVVTNAYIELYVGFYETYDRWTTSYPEIIELGYSDDDGKLIWESPKEGKYTIFTYLKEGGDEKKVSKKVTIDNKTKNYIIDFSS